MQARVHEWRWNFGVGPALRVADAASTIAARSRRVSGVTRGFRRNRRTCAPATAGSTAGCPRASKKKRVRLAQGSTEEEVIIRNPSLSGSRTEGDPTTRRDPPTRLARSPTPPSCRAGSAPRLASIIRFVRACASTSTRSTSTTSNDFRSLDLNAPVDGVRPDPQFGRVLLVQSIGRSARPASTSTLSYSPRQGIFSNIRYGYSRNMNDADDALTPPPPGRCDRMGAARGDVPHRLNWNIGVPDPALGRHRVDERPLQSGSPTTSPPAATTTAMRSSTIARRAVAQQPRGAMTTQTDMRRVVDDAVECVRTAASRSSAVQAVGGGPARSRWPGRSAANQSRRRFEMYLFVQNLSTASTTARMSAS